MRKNIPLRLFGIALFLLIVVAGFGMAVLQLWNLLIPDIFGLHPIGFWQAVGLLALSWILFGGWRGFGRPAGYGPRWRHMTPEQREMFREAMESRCRRPAAPPAESKE